MYEKIKLLLEKHRSILLYILFGGVTTVVNYAVYFPLEWWTSLPATVTNIIAWFISVVVSFLTNKPFVFGSHDWSWRVVWPEASKFIGCRIGSGLLETLMLLVTVDILKWNSLWMKLIACILVIIINYIGSKALFRHKKSNPGAGA